MTKWGGSSMAVQEKPVQEVETLEFYGGVPILLVPFAVMFVGILWLGLSGAA